MRNRNDSRRRKSGENAVKDEKNPSEKQRRRPQIPLLRRKKDTSADYNDGFGIYIEQKNSNRNFLSIFFFPFAALWCEFILRYGCSESFGFNSVLYTFLFTVAITSVLTILCTLGPQRFNRCLCHFFTALLTIWFEFQLLFHSAYGTFARMSKLGDTNFGKVFSSIGACFLPFVLMLVPLALNLVFGKKIFYFRRILIPAKISLALIAVLFYLSAITLISMSKNNPYHFTSYKLYNKKFSTFEASETADRFGLLTMQGLDISDMLKKD